MGSNVYKNTLVRINFQQAAAATTWNINHGIGTMYPVVDVYVLSGANYVRIFPEHISVVDANNVNVVFSQAYAGYATVM